MNTTEYFTYVNAMFLFCIFTCGLLLAVGWHLVRKSDKLKKEQDSHLKATNTNTLLVKENKEIDDKLAESEHKLRDAEKEIRELQTKLDHAEADRIELRAERATLENKLTAALAKVRKRDKDGKFLPSGNGRVRTLKKLKLVTDLGVDDVIHCKTPKQRLAIRKLMHEAGLKWASGISYIDGRTLFDYGKTTYYRPKMGNHGSVERPFEGMVIHPASDFIARPKSVKKVKLKVSADITAVEDAIQGVNNAFSQIKELVDAQPKLIHGLTVKNPTEDEAKMIFDEARRLKIKVSKNDSGVPCPNIWAYHKKICVCVEDVVDYEWVEVVTAQEFVQRMKNGRG